MENSAKNEPIIICENLVKIYKTRDIEVLALQGLELEIARGELMAIIGNSGSGKSTFLNMIGGLDRPSAGRLIVDGKDLFKLSERELVEYKRSTVGFVWQNNARNLLPWLSSWRNVQMPMLFGSTRAKRERAVELLELVGMEHRRKSRLNQLSGGEQQRIAIAIALANNPKILLADEPTGSVDVKTSNYLLDVFRRLNSELGLTIVIVTHDRMLAHKVNRVVSIRDGKTSSERIMHSYAKELESLHGFEDGQADTHEEFAVLDRAGRLQIPREMLSQLGIDGNKVKLEVRDGQIVVEKPHDPAAATAEEAVDAAVQEQ
ncbi:MAG: ATP-binding cassette domain-containing protein [Candidatus Fimadaptatus sp.]